MNLLLSGLCSLILVVVCPFVMASPLELIDAPELELAIKKKAFAASLDIGQACLNQGNLNFEGDLYSVQLACELPKLLVDFFSLSEELQRLYRIEKKPGLTLGALAFRYSPISALENPAEQVLEKSILYLEHFGFIRSAYRGLLWTQVDKRLLNLKSSDQTIGDIKRFILWAESISPIDVISSLNNESKNFALNTLPFLDESIDFNKVLKKWALDALSGTETSNLLLNPGILNNLKEYELIKNARLIVKNSIAPVEPMVPQGSFLYTLRSNHFAKASLNYEYGKYFDLTRLKRFELKRILKAKKFYKNKSIILPLLPMDQYYSGDLCSRVKNFAEVFYLKIWAAELQSEFPQQVNENLYQSINKYSCTSKSSFMGMLDLFFRQSLLDGNNGNENSLDSAASAVYHFSHLLNLFEFNILTAYQTNKRVSKNMAIFSVLTYSDFIKENLDKFMLVHEIYKPGPKSPYLVDLHISNVGQDSFLKNLGQYHYILEGLSGGLTPAESLWEKSLLEDLNNQIYRLKFNTIEKVN